MTIGIRSIDNSDSDSDSDSGAQQNYSVSFHDDFILTNVTCDPDAVARWISDVERIHHHRLRKLVVGIDVEWRPNTVRHSNPLATLQLCVGGRCLIYQLIHAPYIPVSLVHFLEDGVYTFVGVGVNDDLERLERDYGFGGCARRVDLRALAASAYERRDLNGAGLKGLSSVVLDKALEKPCGVTLSRWDPRWLQNRQIKYACVDAYVSFEIGRVLRAWDN